MPPNDEGAKSPSESHLAPTDIIGTPKTGGSSSGAGGGGSSK
jgi:hypothetical protein